MEQRSYASEVGVVSKSGVGNGLGGVVWWVPRRLRSSSLKSIVLCEFGEDLAFRRVNLHLKNKNGSKRHQTSGNERKEEFNNVGNGVEVWNGVVDMA